MARKRPVDFTTMRRIGDAAPRDMPGQRSRRWWELNGSECANSVESTVKALQMAQEARMRQSAISMRLYGNFAMFGAAGVFYARAMTSQTAVRDRITFNAIQSIIDTVHSKIGESKPRPYFLTSGGNYKQQRKAKNLNRFEEGNFYENKTYEKGGLAFRDAEIWGDGFVHVFARNGKIRHERVIGAEIWVDEEEAQYGFPRNMHRVKDVDREELVGHFHDKREAIWKANKSTDKHARSGPDLSDMVKVVESWHLGTADEAGEVKGGRHAISLISNGEMLCEPDDWPHDFFPFAKVPWCPRPTGYWSQGLAEQLQGEQIELNKELLLIQRSMQIAGSVKVFVRNGSKIVKETINNEIGGIINYVGEKPAYECPAPIHPVYFENVNRIIERMYQKAGVSEISASGKKPAGLDSGRALREQQDIESDRFRTVQRYNENFYLAIAALDIAIARETPSMGSVRIPGKGEFTEVNFKKDIGPLKDSEFVMQCFPVSRLPKDPAGRLQTIQEYVAAGFISQRQGRRALDFPDIDAIDSLANAQEDLITKVLDDIIDEGEYAPPEPTDDLKLGKEMVLEYIQRYRLLDLENEKLSMLRTWSQQIDALISKTMTMPAPVSAAEITPQAAPEAQPTSDLVQNVPGQAAA